MELLHTYASRLARNVTQVCVSSYESFLKREKKQFWRLLPAHPPGLLR